MTEYTVLTPVGSFTAYWSEDEDELVKYSGSPAGIAYLDSYIENMMLTRPGGYRLSLKALEPVDLIDFCQSEDAGITVIPDAAGIRQEGEPMTMLDAVSAADEFAMIGEGAQILKRLDEDSDTFFTDLGRLREIVLLLGGDDSAPNPNARVDAVSAALLSLGWKVSGPAGLTRGTGAKIGSYGITMVKESETHEVVVDLITRSENHAYNDGAIFISDIDVEDDGKVSPEELADKIDQQAEMDMEGNINTEMDANDEQVIDDDRSAFNGMTLKFALSAMAVEQAVKRNGGVIQWGDFTHTEKTGSLLDSVTYGTCGQIGKSGRVIARVSIDRQGAVTFYAGSAGTNAIGTTGAIAKKRIADAVDTVFASAPADEPTPAAGPVISAPEGASDRVIKLTNEANDLYQRAVGLGLNPITPDQYMADIESGNRSGFSIAGMKASLQEYKSMLVSVQTGTLPPRKVVGTGGTKKDAIEYLKKNIGESSAAIDAGGMANETNIRNYRFYLSGLIRTGKDETFTSNETLAAEAAARAKREAEMVAEAEAQAAKAAASRQYEVGSESGMKTPLTFVYSVNTAGGDHILAQLADIDTPQGKYDFLEGRIRADDRAVKRVDQPPFGGLDFNGARRKGIQFGYFKIEPRKGFSKITLTIDVSGKVNGVTTPATATAMTIKPNSPEGYAAIMADKALQLQYQDALDALFQSRIVAVKNALVALGWSGGSSTIQQKSVGGSTYGVTRNTTNVGAGANIVAVSWVSTGGGYTIADDLTKTPEELAKQIDAAVAPASTVAAPASQSQANAAIKALSPFLSSAQRGAIKVGVLGEESQFFRDKAVEMAKVIADMPKSYGQDGKGDAAVAYLHYFKGSADWYITEKDMSGDGTEQAFGYADLGQGGELGYISIAEIVSAGAELDLHWSPKTLGEIKGGYAAPADNNAPAPAVDRMDEAKKMVYTVAGEVDGTLSPWAESGNVGWQYSKMTITKGDKTTILNIGVSAGGVVQVDGNPFDPDKNVNDNIASVRKSVAAVLPKEPDMQAEMFKPFDPASVKMPTAPQLSLKTLGRFRLLETGGWSNGYVLDINNRPKVITDAFAKYYNSNPDALKTIDAAAAESYINKFKSKATTQVEPTSTYENKGETFVVLTNEQASTAKAVNVKYFGYFFKAYKGARFFTSSDDTDPIVMVKKGGSLVGFMSGLSYTGGQWAMLKYGVRPNSPTTEPQPSPEPAPSPEPSPAPAPAAVEPASEGNASVNAAGNTAKSRFVEVTDTPFNADAMAVIKMLSEVKTMSDVQAAELAIRGLTKKIKDHPFYGYLSDSLGYRAGSAAYASRLINTGIKIGDGEMKDYDTFMKFLGELANKPWTRREYKEAAVEPATAPSLSLTEDTALIEAKTFLQTVVDGSADYWDAGLEAKLTALYERFNGKDAAFDDLFNKAAEAYSNAMIQAAKAAMT